MRLCLENHHTFVDFDSQEEMDWLINFCAFKDTTNAYKMVDGVLKYDFNTLRHMFNQSSKSFPTGLASLVVVQGEKRGFSISVEDHRVRHGWVDRSADLGWLRDYQQEAVWTCAERTRGVMRLVTGAGKTECAIGLTRAIQGVKWLFLAPETRLMYQAADRYELRTGDVAGRIGDGEWSIGDTFTTATFQTLSQRLKADYKEACKFLGEFTGFIIDEFHSASADDFVHVAEHVTNAYWRFGMSGTALDRGDRRDMLATGLVGRVIYYKPAEDLIAEGYVAMPKVVFHPVEHTIAPKANPLVVYSVNIVKNSKRNVKIAELTAAAGKPALVGVRTAGHGLAILKLLKAMGVRAEFMRGSGMTQKQQDAMIARLRDLTTEVIVATKVLQTGTDIEEIATVVNARGNASTIETLQLVGRGMRMIRDPAGNIVKGTVDVVEFYDVAVPHINPLTNRKNTQKELKWLQDYSDQRVAAYRSMGYDVKVLSAAAPTGQGTQLVIPLPTT
jgi:superfamily II DNA or RNA helicase